MVWQKCSGIRRSYLAPNLLTDWPGGPGTDCRTEVDEGLAITIFRQTQSEREAQEIEARFRIVSPPVSILTVDHTGVVRVQLLSTLCKTLPQLLHQRPSLRVAVTVTHSTIQDQRKLKMRKNLCTTVIHARKQPWRPHRLTRHLLHVNTFVMTYVTFIISPEGEWDTNRIALFW